MNVPENRVLSGVVTAVDWLNDEIITIEATT